MFPFLENWVLYKSRKKVFNKFKRYINLKNIEFLSNEDEDKIYTVSFWHSDNFEKGQVILMSEQAEESGAKPFQLMLTGSASVDKPLKICPNTNLVIHHLRSIHIESVSETKNTFNIFSKLLDLLNVHLL